MEFARTAIEYQISIFALDMENVITFEDYLMKKKIDHEEFLSNETDLFGEWKSTFNQLHPDSFTAQKLFLINPIRRKYPLKEGK